MNILILDDDQSRHDWFSAQLRGKAKLWHAYTATEAKLMLDDRRFDVAFLDHDIDCTDPRNTGHDVARYIACMANEARPGVCVVHSWNPDGAKRMRQTLHEAGCEHHGAMFGQPELAAIVRGL